MNTENHTCLTDAEFIRMHEYSSDPLLRQAYERLDALIDKILGVDLAEKLEELQKELG